MEYELYHYGVLGMKWGIRRYQNKDGSLTPAGRKRYSGISGRKKYNKDVSQIETRLNKLKWKENQTEKTAEEIEFLETALKGLREVGKLPPAFIRIGSDYLKRDRVSSVNNNSPDSMDISDDEKKFRELMTKNVSQLSTQDLQFVNNRIQARNAYINNTESPTRKFLRTTATQVASQLASEYLKAGTKAVLNWSGKKVSNFASGKSRKDQAWEDLLNNMKNHSNSGNTNNTSDNNAQGKKKNKKGK